MRFFQRLTFYGCLFASIVSFPSLSRAERLVQSATERRTYLFVKSDDGKIKNLLPAGWSPAQNVGPLKDANFVIVLIEGVAGSDAEGKSILYQGKTVVLGIPAKNDKTGEPGFMVSGGFVSDASTAPGAYGLYAPASVTMAKTSRSDGDAATAVTEQWRIRSEKGDRIDFDVGYDRGTGNWAHAEPHVYSALHPEFYRIYKVDQVTEIVHTTAQGGKKAKEVKLSADGPQISRFFDDKSQLVAVISYPAYYRKIYLPE
ncbi:MULTISPECIES: hypothetical protein [Methylobacterium]|uniref:hypothetical protein n=1 Tax=Methylobacterium TaxID=407 RepID=UPI0013EC5DDA|nr:hypothetical protein [Methylobacterium sp. DB0501]NGM34303.1 hypothetical protein [Methylobacterium sp. DB0501]